MRSEVQKLPELFLKRLAQVVPRHKFDSIANTFTERKPTTFRVNTLKVEAQFIAPLQQRLEHQRFRLEKVSWYSDAFVVHRGTQRELEKTEAYLKGELYIQNLSSMIPPLVLKPEPGECVLDLTAAPGSKTTQISAMMIPPPTFSADGGSFEERRPFGPKVGGGMNGEGEVLAVENDPIRFEKLRANILLQGARNVTVVLEDGERIGKKYPGRFDRVLLDAPCSAEGRFLTSEPSSYRYWKLEKVTAVSKIQKKLIHSALLALKPGGILVYSTCTFAPEENEAVVNEVLERFRDVEVVGAIHELPLHSI
ncbi:MAG: RsmB/NOP family class I SAM-dependent RNA methyltransferase, partial [Candidatus Omnitrophica bacterium]|nr:RsmB/NOP family class I SAM-dependent RNA methyltransferase [Candidatus Omnitrophota bacterium]